MARVSGDFVAIFSRTRVRASSSAAGTTSLTRPKRNAVAASIKSPESNICMACFCATLRDSATIGVEQNSPMFTPGVAKRASSAAKARSALATSCAPAAVATPCTRAITGFEQIDDGLHHLGAERESSSTKAGS